MYLQFHHTPLYLEWAPVGVFTDSVPTAGPTTADSSAEEAQQAQPSSTEKSEPSPAGDASATGGVKEEPVKGQYLVVFLSLV